MSAIMLSGSSFRGRTQAQRDFVTAQRARMIESGEFEEKAGLLGLAGLPPVAPSIVPGESMFQLRARASLAGIYLPGMNGRQQEIARLRNEERAKGMKVLNFPVKERYAISQGLDGRAAWDIPDLVEYDFSYANIAAASTIPGGILGIMPGTNAPAIGSPDDIGPLLAAATATRVVGSGANHYATVLAFWVFLRTAAGGVYAPANLTLALTVISAGANANQIRSALTAAFGLNTATQFWTNLALTVPAERQPSPYGVVITTAAMIFLGDYLQAELVAAAAVNIQGNTVSGVVEMV